MVVSSLGKDSGSNSGWRNVWDKISTQTSAKPSTLAEDPAHQLVIEGQSQVFMTGPHLNSNLDTQAPSSSMPAYAGHIQQLFMGQVWKWHTPLVPRRKGNSSAPPLRSEFISLET